MPQDTSGIDIAGIRSRALTGSDPDLHFLPPAEATTAYAQGGRTGYYAGDMVEQKENIIKAFSAYKNQGGVKDFRDWFSGEYLPERPDMTRAPDEVDPWAEGAPYGYGEPGEIPEQWDLDIVKPEMRAQGGRIGYRYGGADTAGVTSNVPEARRRQIEGSQMADEAYNKIFRKFYERFPGIEEELSIEQMIAMLQRDAVMDTENLGILGLDKSMGMITPQSVSKDVQRISRGDTQYGDVPEELFRAQGGRIGAQEGGLMDLGGMEKDYRQEGGFVPIGGQEKADDVPARLSKNEFVFTADAVRAAGGGDIDKGAEVMENVMNNLEQGGQVSEESQGLEGARNMFATAQRLEGVL
jgi:hypothetical protein